VRDPTLSVVTPVFNSIRYLPSALHSVAQLTVPHEHIVVDGGSSDGTVDLLRGRSDASLVWTSEPDRGQTHAVNKGLDRARGMFVAWLNGDDELVPEAFDAAVAYLLAHPHVDAVYGGLDIVDERGELRRRYQPRGYSWRRYLFMGDYISTPTIIFRRRLLDEVGRLDEAYADAADYDFYLRIFRRSRVERMPRPHVRFRVHPDSKSVRDVWLQQREALEIRLKWARNPFERAAMRGFDRVKRAILPRISPWPKPFA
jgi:glycosyltransferase involved in cell wall biosynthesis